MIKGIGYKKVELTKEEFEYYEQLVKTYTDDKAKGSAYFEELFDVDESGKITIIKPTKNVPWAILFFVQNLMISQHLRTYEERIEKLEQKNESNNG